MIPLGAIAVAGATLGVTAVVTRWRMRKLDRRIKLRRSVEACAAEVEAVIVEASAEHCDLFGNEGEPKMPKYTKVQARHDAPARAFLATLEAAGGKMKSTDIKDDFRVRAVCRKRGFAKSYSMGMGAGWAITDAGKAFLATAPVVAAEEKPAIVQIGGAAELSDFQLPAAA